MGKAAYDRDADVADRLHKPLQDSDDNWIESGVSSGRNSFSETSSSIDEASRTTTQPTPQTSSSGQSPSKKHNSPFTGEDLEGEDLEGEDLEGEDLEGQLVKRRCVGKKEVWTCFDCLQQFYRKYDFQEHVGATHMEPRYFFCPFGNKANSSKECSFSKCKSMKSHLSERHGIVSSTFENSEHDACVKEKLRILFAEMKEEHDTIKEELRDYYDPSDSQDTSSNADGKSDDDDNNAGAGESVASANPTQRDSENSSAEGHGGKGLSDQDGFDPSNENDQDSDGHEYYDSSDHNGESYTTKQGDTADDALSMNLSSENGSFAFEHKDDLTRLSIRNLQPLISLCKKEEESYGSSLPNTIFDDMIEQLTQSYAEYNSNPGAIPSFSNFGLKPPTASMTSTSPSTLFSSKKSRSSATSSSLFSEKLARPRLSQFTIPLFGLFPGGRRPLTIPKWSDWASTETMERWYLELRPEAPWSPLNARLDPEYTQDLSRIDEEFEFESDNEFGPIRAALGKLDLFEDLRAREERCGDVMNAVDRIFSKLQLTVPGEEGLTTQSRPQTDDLKHLSAL